MPTNVMTPRDFCSSTDLEEWFPVARPHWNTKRNTLLVEMWQRARAQAAAGTVPDVRTLEGKFLEQAEKWDRETAHMSSPLQRMMHPSYQAILGMGAASPHNKREIVRFMLRDLRKNHREWFLALSYLTEQNPISPKDHGKTSKMIASWLKWGEGQGLL